MMRPSARTTSSPSTESRVTPYFTQRRPPALVARLPPIVEVSKLLGSGAYIRPTSRAARSTSAVMAPASTTASWAAADPSGGAVNRGAAAEVPLAVVEAGVITADGD